MKRKYQKFLYMLCIFCALCVTGCSIGDGEQITQLNTKYLQTDSPTVKNTQEPSEATAAQEQTKAPEKQKKAKKSKKKQSATPKKQETSANSTKNTATPSKKKQPESTSKSRTKTKKKSTASKAKTTAAPKSTLSPETSPEAEGETCTVSIDCKTILSNKAQLKSAKKSFVPSDGWILKETEVTIQENDSAYDILSRICKKKGIHMESSYTPAYKTYYVVGIHQLYQFDCGELSGWNYLVNGKTPNYGSSKYKVKAGDRIQWRYTCNAGKDIT